MTAAKTGGARERYNRAATLVTALVGEWRQKTGPRRIPALADAIASGPDAVDRLGDITATGLPLLGVEPLQQRLEHFLVEDGVLVPAAIEALPIRRPTTISDASRTSRNAPRNTCSGTRCQRRAPWCDSRDGTARVPPSAFGAGFGGSVWALVPIVDAERFAAAWRTAYAAQHPRAASDASFFSTRPSQGAHAVE